MRAVRMGLMVLVGSGVCSLAAAQDDAVVGKQRQTADDLARKLAEDKATLIESKNFIVAGAIPEPVAKKVAAALELRYATLVKTLQFEKDAPPWKGKLAVYLVDDRATFRKFIRQTEGRSPDASEETSQKIAGEMPHIAAVAPKAARDALPYEQALIAPLASGMLKARGGTAPVPEWLVLGYGRAMAMQVGPPKPDRKANARKLLAANVQPQAAWATEETPDDVKQLAATYLADYLVNARIVPKLGDFLAAFRQDGSDEAAAFNDAPLKLLKQTPEQFAIKWQMWLKAQ